MELGNFMSEAQRIKLNSLKTRKQEQDEDLKAKFNELHHFSTVDEMVQYLKSGNTTIYRHDDTYEWDFQKPGTPIKWRHQVSDGNDCRFWYVDDYFSVENFIAHVNRIINKFPDSAYDNIGKIDSFTKLD